MELDRQERHDLGYWMSVFGFAVVVLIGMFYSFISLDAQIAVAAVVVGFLLFVAGAELALRNQKHEEA